MFPLHEQRILNQLMTSWVQAVCERQPLGGKYQHFILKKYNVHSLILGKKSYSLLSNIPFLRVSILAVNNSICFADDICDYFGVKIGMYFAWLGFYTNSMLYPAVIGFLLWILAEADQVLQTSSVLKYIFF